MSVRPASSAENSTFAHMLPAVADHRPDGFERLLAAHLQLHAKVQIGGSPEKICRRGEAARFQKLQ